MSANHLYHALGLKGYDIVHEWDSGGVANKSPPLALCQGLSGLCAGRNRYEFRNAQRPLNP